MTKISKLAFKLFIVLLIALTWMSVKTESALRPYHFIGKVESISEDSISVETKERINSGADRDWDVSSELLEGEPPNGDLQGEISVGDWVEIGSLGAPENFVVVAKVVTNGEARIIDIYGDPRFLGLPWLQGYNITYKNQPDCTSCSGTVCVAKSTTLSITGPKKDYQVELKPGQTHATETITVKFNSGEAPASKCNTGPSVGPQPVSNFTIHLYESGRWEPYTPDKEMVTISIDSIEEVAFSTVEIQFPTPCYRGSWLPVDKSGDRFMASAVVFSPKDGFWCPQVVTPFTHTYDLGGITPGHYEFDFNVWGKEIKSRGFEITEDSGEFQWDKVGILPAPVTSDTAQLSLKNLGVPVDSFTLEIFDLCGRRVLKETYNKQTVELNLSDLGNGLYLYLITAHYGDSNLQSPIKKFLILR